MKSLEELKAIRDRVQNQMDMRNDNDNDTRIVIGMCRLEQIVEIFKPGEEKVTYVKMTPDKVAKVVTEHIVNGRPVMEYTIGAAQTGGK